MRYSETVVRGIKSLLSHVMAKNTTSNESIQGDPVYVKQDIICAFTKETKHLMLKFCEAKLSIEYACLRFLERVKEFRF